MGFNSAINKLKVHVFVFVFRFLDHSRGIVVSGSLHQYYNPKKA